MSAKAWQLIRATRGPLFLTAFGTLMALHYMGRIGFDRTWPTLLILYGVSKLLERMVARPVPAAWPPPPPTPPSTPPPSATEYPRYTPPSTGYPQGGAQ